MTEVVATDYDDPAELDHTSLTYAIEKNVIDEHTGKPIFDIDPLTGRYVLAVYFYSYHNVNLCSLIIIINNIDRQPATSSHLCCTFSYEILILLPTELFKGYFSNVKHIQTERRKNTLYFSLVSIVP